MGIITHHPLALAQMLVSEMRIAGQHATDPVERRMWQREQHEAARRLEILRAQLRSTQKNNVFPLPVRGGVEAE